MIEIFAIASLVLQLNINDKYIQKEKNDAIIALI